MSQILRWAFPSCFTDETVRKKTAEHNANLALASLQNCDWGQLRLLFMVLLRYIMTEKMLEKGWQFAQLTFGRFEHHGPPSCSVGWLYTTVTVPIQFKRVRMVASMQMTFSGDIFSLRLYPALSSEWKTPSYAPSPDEIKQMKARLGKGLFKVGGTITLPAKPGKYPCVILIAGSGPLSRDSEVGALKPFKDIALGLAKQGIATCRLDKVTYTYRLWYMLNRRQAQRITLLGEYSQVSDAIRYVSRHSHIDSSRIYTLGHSLGGLLAAHAAATEQLVTGYILMATPYESIYRSAIRQFRYLASIEDSEEVAKKTLSDAEELETKAALADSSDLSLSTPAEKLPFGIGPSYWLECRRLSIQKTATQLRKRILVLQGSRDYQVDMEDYEKMHASLVDHDNAGFRVFDRLNHCFVAGEGVPNPAEDHNQGNVSVDVIEAIGQWVKRPPQ
ncbi:Alpha/Beta hydrolase protein [Aspergillus spectabilis]